MPPVYPPASHAAPAEPRRPAGLSLDADREEVGVHQAAVIDLLAPDGVDGRPGDGDVL